MTRWLFPAIVLLLVGCSQPAMDTTPPTNIAASNAIRKKIGIRQIQNAWKFYGREFDCEKWQAGKQLVKIVQRSGPEKHASLFWEQDYYYGTGSLSDPDGVKMQEQVVVTYDYDQARFFVAYTGENKQALNIINNIVVYDPKPGDVVSEMGHAGKSNTETLKVADELTKLIGQNRLNMPFPKSGK